MGCSSNSTGTGAGSAGGAASAGGASTAGGSSTGGNTSDQSATAIGGGTSAGGTAAMGGTNPNSGGTIAAGGTLSIGGSATAAGGSSVTATGGRSMTAAGGAAGGTSAGGTVAAGGATKTGGASNVGGTSMATGGHPTTVATGAGGAATGGTPTTGGTKSAGGSGGTATGGGTSTACPNVDFGTWTTGKDPLTVGKLAVSDFNTHKNDDYGGAGYSLAFSWYGSLRFNELQGTSNADLVSSFDAKLAKSPPPNTPGPSRYDNGTGATVDDRAFGVLPLEIYIEQGGDSYLTLGLERADMQFSDANTNKATGESYDVRYWADDMYMITGLQVQAYRARKITPSKASEASTNLNNASSAMLKYITALQQTKKNSDNQMLGLFWHTKTSHAYWGRANGWIAAGMTELLLELPPGDTRNTIMNAFKTQMNALLDVQIKKGDVAGDADVGCWRQVLDLSTTSAETSCTAMFTYSLANALENGWLSGSNYVDAAHNGWACVANKTGTTGKLAMVCPGTGAAPNGDLASQQAFYAKLVDPNNPPSPGDLHGQAPLLWAAAALLRTGCTDSH